MIILNSVSEGEIGQHGDIVQVLAGAADGDGLAREAVFNGLPDAAFLFGPHDD